MDIRKLLVHPDLASSPTHAEEITARRNAVLDGHVDHDSIFVAAKVVQLAYQTSGKDVLACVLTTPVEHSQALVLSYNAASDGRYLHWKTFEALSPQELVLASTVAAIPGNLSRPEDAALLRSQMPGFPTPVVTLENGTPMNVVFGLSSMSLVDDELIQVDINAANYDEVGRKYVDDGAIDRTWY